MSEASSQAMNRRALFRARFLKDSRKTIEIPEYKKVPLSTLFKQNPVPLSVHPQLDSSFIPQESSQFTFTHCVLDGKRKVCLERMPSYSESSFMSYPAFQYNKAQPKLKCDLPSLDCILYYDIQSQYLTVIVKDGKFLNSTEMDISRPYVTLHLMPHKEEIFRTKTTDTISEMESTEFNEAFTFKHISYSEIWLRTLVLSVYNEQRFSRNHLLGIARIPLEKTELFGVKVSVVLNITPDDEDKSKAVNGDIKVSLTYNQSSNVLSGMIIKASNLKRMDLLTFSDPYVKLKIYYNNSEESVMKWQSKVIKNTLTPEFHQDFVFDLADMSVEDIMLKLVVKDKDVFSKDDYIGKVEFSRSTTHDSGKSHWEEMIRNPFTRITHWHTLI